MKIALVISSLSGGGAERVMSIMANYWVAKDKEITLITFTSEDIYDIPVKRAHSSQLAIPASTTDRLLSGDTNSFEILRDVFQRL